MAPDLAPPASVKRLREGSKSASKSGLVAVNVKMAPKGRRGPPPPLQVPHSGGPRRKSPRPPEEGPGYAPLPTSDPEAGSTPAIREGEADGEASLAARVLESSTFQGCMMAVIMANAVVIGCETDFSWFQYWDDIENFFLAVFTVELVMKILVQGRDFVAFRSQDFGWNCFDVLIVGLGIVDVSVKTFVTDHGGSGATLFRVVRLCRIMRLLRIVRFLRELYLLAFGFLEACQAMVWVTLLMTVLLYVCSIILVRTCGRLPEDDPYAQFLHEKFADIRTSMLTLFVLMSSPNLPAYMEQDGLLWSRPFLLFFLIGFIIIGSFGMVALLTGVISENMFEKNQLRMEESRREQEEFLTMLEERTEDIHASLLRNENGEATREEVADVAMPLVVRLFEERMVPFTLKGIATLVDMMDIDNSGLINQEEFSRAILNYAGGDKPLSMQEVHWRVVECFHKISYVEDLLKRVMEDGLGLKAHEASVTPTRATRRGSFSGGPTSPKVIVSSRTADPWAAQVDGVPRLRPPAAAVGVGPDLAEHFQELRAVVREAAERQMAAQRELEALILRSFTGLRTQLREDLLLLSADLERRPPPGRSSPSSEVREACQAPELVPGPPGLPGGFDVGEVVTSKISFQCRTGTLSRGDVGVVRGPSTVEDKGRVNVDFPNLKSVNMLPTQLSKEALPCSSASGAGASGVEPSGPAATVPGASGAARQAERQPTPASYALGEPWPSGPATAGIGSTAPAAAWASRGPLGEASGAAHAADSREQPGRPSLGRLAIPERG